MPDGLAARGTGVVLAYGGQTAVEASDFSIPAGRLTAIIGPNGSGKSSLLNALAGLLLPRRGDLAVLGRPPGKARRRVAYVLQSTKVNEVMPITVRETVAMGRYALLGPWGFLRGPHRRAYLEAMERLEIADLAGRHLHELSGGQRQRVFVAQGLAQQADCSCSTSRSPAWTWCPWTASAPPSPTRSSGAPPWS
jgi:manganese transport system ATP-binding protein